MDKKIKSRYLLIFLLLFITSVLIACGDEGESAEETISLSDAETRQEVTAEDVTVLNDVVDKTSVVLFFANDNGYLVAQQREIPKVDGLARMTMYELAKGPAANSGLLPTLPPGTELKDINIKGGLCTVDFSSELKQNHSGGSGNEQLTVYSIVNTLTQYASVQEVQILIDGEVVETLAGHINLAKPLTREDSIITSANP
ncbi:GerMN domain-containing protein [Peptococcaceae bacterium 1198_IL3148]